MQTAETALRVSRGPGRRVSHVRVSECAVHVYGRGEHDAEYQEENRAGGRNGHGPKETVKIEQVCVIELGGS
jgi:hypothetical protein